ncbi:LysE/ArgO family amino acid transporter [Microbacterium sp. NPDC055903]
MISFFSGLGLGLSLIVAIGAQNVYVLRQGIRREHVALVVIICALSDAVLIVAGVAGIGFVIERAPWLVTAARILGATFLLGYAVLAARRAWRGEEALDIGDEDLTDRPRRGAEGSSPQTTHVATSAMPVVLTVLALTWLNPHVYLDTVLMLGSIAATHGAERWWFAGGAVLASCLWFTALGFGARFLARWLDSARSWRILDAIVAIVMAAIAVTLILPVVSG